MKRFLLVLSLVMTSLSCWAIKEMDTHPMVHNIGGVWYQNINGQAWVSSRWHYGYEYEAGKFLVLQDWNSYSGDVSIADSIVWSESDDIDTPTVEGSGEKIPVVGIMEIAFRESEGLTSVSIGKNVRTIEACAFQSCNALTELTIPASVDSIGATILQYCSGLKKLTVADGETLLRWNGIGEWVYLDAFEELYIGRPYQTAEGNNAFRSLKMKKITFGDSVDQIYNEDLIYCDQLETCILGKGIKRIGNKAFQGTSALKSIVIPEGVTEIGDEAFSSSGITTISLPSTLKKMGNNMFQNSSLVEITIPGSVEELGACPFEYCSKLKKVTFADGETTLKWDRICDNWPYMNSFEEIYIGRPYQTAEGNNAFRSLPIKKIAFGNSVDQIYDEDLIYCNQLETCILGNGIKRIGNKAFQGTSALKSIVIPEGVTEIGDEAFKSSGITTISLPPTLKRINYGAFMYCSFDDITIPASVDYMGGWVFYYGGAKKLTLEDGPNLLEWAIDNESDYTGFEELYVGRPYKTPGNREAFKYGQKKITFGDYVEELYDNDLVWQSNLETVIIGKGMKKIAGNTFPGCNNVKELRVAALVPPVVDGESLGDVPSETCQLYVPAASLNAYKQADVWKNFFNIETGIVGVKADNNDSSWYSLDGKRVVAPEKGLYVKDGKKVLHK